MHASDGVASSSAKFQNDEFLAHERTRAWLAQFAPEDLAAAIELLRTIKLVSADNFSKELQALLLEVKSHTGGPVGLYVEREIPLRGGFPIRLFKETRTKVKRAIGIGPKPVLPTPAYDPKVGSEGLIAQLVSELCKQYPKEFLMSPGPAAIRKYRIRRMVVVTDFVGSGTRVWNFLNSAWRVRSVRSWWSARKSTGLDIQVVAYAATAAGKELVESHASRPILHVADTVITLKDETGSNKYPAITDLCMKYAPPLPRMRKSLFGGVSPLGVGGAGALIAFAHGIPNNAPKLLYGSGKGWVPLFPSRTTSDSRQTFGRQPTTADVAKRLERLGQVRLSQSKAITGGLERRRQMLLVLAALGRSPRFNEVVSVRTGLDLRVVQEAIARATVHGLINVNRRITEAGRSEIEYAKKTTPPKRSGLSFKSADTYYPSQLRVPK
jgi:hypothetical protein